MTMLPFTRCDLSVSKVSPLLITFFNVIFTIGALSEVQKDDSNFYKSEINFVGSGNRIQAMRCSDPVPRSLPIDIIDYIK